MGQVGDQPCYFRLTDWVMFCFVLEGSSLCMHESFESGSGIAFGSDLVRSGRLNQRHGSGSCLVVEGKWVKGLIKPVPNSGPPSWVGSHRT